MSYSSAPTEHVAKTKPHVCDWCGEGIPIGSRYRKWVWRSDSDGGVCVMHPECHVAMEATAQSEGGWCEFFPGFNERPASCEGDREEETNP